MVLSLSPIPLALRHISKPFYLLLLVMILALGSKVSLAQTTGCDLEYMDAMEARAWMEAQREIAQNQNLIFKQDSVLQYTCFNSFISNVVGSGAVLFSDPAVTASSLSAMVGAALTSYLSANFAHNSLGGRGIVWPAGAAGGNYGCSAMGAVWQAAKCMNFHNLSVDEFWDFPYYATTDPRVLPQACNAGAIAATTALFSNSMVAAFNNQQAYYTLAPDNNGILDANAYQNDNVQSYLERILPAGAPAPGGGATVCQTPIRTGVTVRRVDYIEPVYQDAVCPNPGCTYVPTGAATGDCVQ